MSGGSAKEKRLPKSVPHKDNYARVSFLYQAAHNMVVKPQYAILGRGLARNLDLVSKKSVMKTTPAMKRKICKKCNTPFIAGINVQVYIENHSKKKEEKANVLVHECTSCGHKKRFPIGRNPSYKLQVEREENTYEAD